MTDDRLTDTDLPTIEPVEGMRLDPNARTLQVDVERYRAFLAEAGLDPVQERELIEALWAVMVGFVELGFGVHPVQQAAAKSRSDKHNSPHRGANVVELECSHKNNKTEESEVS